MIKNAYTQVIIEDDEKGTPKASVKQNRLKKGF